MVRAARSWIGTPFQHQGRRPGQGLDCIGLVVEAYRAAGMVIRDRVNYSRQGDGVMLAEALSEHVSRFDAGEAMPGDIIMFNMRGSPVHVGIATDVGMVHTHAGIGRVVEHALDWPWRRRAIAAWGLR